MDATLWRMRMNPKHLLIIALGGATLGFLFTVMTYLQSQPWLMVLALIEMLGGPIIGYSIGRIHETTISKEREHDHAQSLVSMFNMMSNGKMPTVIDVAPKRKEPLAFIRNGQRVNPAIDYKQMATEWLRAGYPTFDRDFLRRAGASVGANDNYTKLTGFLSANNMISEGVGMTPDDPADARPHRVYSWENARGELIPRDRLQAWINNSDFSVIDAADVIY